jgi:outer membrane protein OmpA-like peptidoglycan-associated protein
MRMTRWFVLLSVLGLTSSLPGCATREFVRGEIARSEAVLRPAVDRLAGEFREHRIAVWELGVQTAAVDRLEEEATRAAIEALGVADVAAGRAADAVDHATLALARADEAGTRAEQAVAEADQTARRLVQLWSARSKLAVVEAIVLRFGVDEWALDDRARAAALEIAKRLRENPSLVVQLEGYADGAGAPPHNLRLSQLRAEAVGRFLAEQGVETHRLQVIGLGTARPVADNGTQEGRRQNRRVVLRLLEPS